MPPPASPAFREPPPSPRPESVSSLWSLSSRRNGLKESNRITQLEQQLQSRVGTLEGQLEEQTRLRSDQNSLVAQLEQQLDESAALASSMKETVAQKESLERAAVDKLKAKQVELTGLEAQLKRTQAELEEERTELGAQVDELRQAGQETIALYEERLNDAEKDKYELEARVSTLESRAAAAARSPSPTSPPPKVASSATEIDNEALREQVVHLQRKVGKLEDALEDAQAAAEREEAALTDRMRRLKEKEDAMKKELTEGRKEVDRMNKAEGAARRRVEEVEAALQESTATLEDARAEVEGLRNELANLDGLVSDNGDAGDLYTRVAKIVDRGAAEKQRLTDEIDKLRLSLEDARRGHSGISQETDNLRQTLAAQTAEIESLKKKANRDVGFNNGIAAPSSPLPSKHDLSAAREEIKGLKLIVQELQKENLAATQRTKLVESENQMLLTETEQLRQEVQILEENLDNSLLKEEEAHDDTPGDSSSLQRLLKDQKAKFEMETEKLRKQVTDMERKHARDKNDFNKEIGELEALIESKIYREDELEQELERTKQKLAKQRKSSKGSTEPQPSTRKRSASVASETSDNGEPVCEICEQRGHEIFSCPLLSADSPKDARGPSAAGDPQELFCTDCEAHGHLADACPHSMDVF
ncbi:hypothetical protein MKEN_00662000 [Mycena kentingensis (nom. inval.)]|nr:hypothetical protein MKEN_00662000 [Mycena kentingensis (nom. inval.)]